MNGSAQLRGARAPLGIDQRELAGLSRLSKPTIQRMEARNDTVRGNVESLVNLIAAFDKAGVEFVTKGAKSQGGGRGVRFKALTRAADSASFVSMESELT